MNKPLLLTILVSASAFAQETAPPPPPPQPIASPVRADSPMVEEDPGGRFRWGVSGNLGWHFPTSAFMLGAEARAGWQISNMFGAYLIGGGTVGIGFGVTTAIQGATVSATVLSYGYFGAIAELMLGNLFYVGGGPVLANGVYVSSSVGASADGVAEVKGIVSAGWKPGLDLRLGLGLGRVAGPPSFRRGGFNLGINTLILLHPNSIITTVRADGPNGSAGASVTTNGLTASVIPMLTLGYDAR